MGLSDDLENLERLQREGALSNEEFRRAKAALLSPSSEATKSPQSSASNRKWNRAVIAAAVLLVLAAVGAGGAVVALTGEDKETIDQRSDTDCESRSKELLDQNKPMAEVYPTLRGMGCGKWLDEQFDKAGSQ